MEIDYRKSFVKAFRKLPKALQDKVEDRIALFRLDPHHFLLKNHALTGNMKGLRAFSVTGDVRVIYQEEKNHVLVIMLDVGRHGRVYC